MKWGIWGILACLIIFCSLEPVFTQQVSTSGKENTNKDQKKSYSLELDRWNISNKGTDPLATTKGLNNALQWAHEKGFTTFHVPSGTYLIAKDSRINMVSDMTFLLEEDVVLQKETNGKEHYELLSIGPGVKNVTLKGGTYKGDKDSHDYSQKDSPYSAGTHESGYGIITKSAENITIEGIKAINFTGDGLCICSASSLIDEFYEEDFESGGVDSNGQLVNDDSKVRLTNLKVNHPFFKTQSTFQFIHSKNLPSKTYDAYFFKGDGTFISSSKENTVGWGLVNIPKGADYFHAVFHFSSAKETYVEYWVQTVSKNVVVKNSEFAFNRRQGITVGGAENVVIKNNSIHDIKGVNPQSGIDVEAGYQLNNDIKIKDNHFYNNQRYDVILYDGKNVTVEDNLFASKGAIGLATSKAFSNGLIKDNTFDGTSIYAYKGITFEGNVMKNSLANFFGPELEINGMTFFDTQVNINSSEPFGVKVSNIIMHHSNNRNSGLNINKQPVHLKNVTSKGAPTLRAIAGSGADESIFDNLKVMGYNSTIGLDLPRGMYNGCEFEAAEEGKVGIQLNDEGKYVFNNCTFKTNSEGGGSLKVTNDKLELVVKNSSFVQQGDFTTINVQAAKKVVIRDNSFESNNMLRPELAIIRIGGYWKRNEQINIENVSIIGNTIRSNIATKGISTIYAGENAQPYSIEGNILYNAKLDLKDNDVKRIIKKDMNEALFW